jgi:hypothetical protein
MAKRITLIGPRSAAHLILGRALGSKSFPLFSWRARGEECLLAKPCPADAPHGVGRSSWDEETLNLGQTQTLSGPAQDFNQTYLVV